MPLTEAKKSDLVIRHAKAVQEGRDEDAADIKREIEGAEH